MPFQPGYSPLEQRMEHLEREFVRLGQSGQNPNQQAQGAGGSGAVVIQATGTLTGPIPEDQVIFDATGGHDHSAGNSTAVPMSGDVTGTNQAAVVVRIEGVPLSGAPAAGDDHKFLRYDSGLNQFVYSGAVMLAPDSATRNLIVPTGAFPALTAQPFADDGSTFINILNAAGTISLFGIGAPTAGSVVSIASADDNDVPLVILPNGSTGTQTEDLINTLNFDTGLFIQVRRWAIDGNSNMYWGDKTTTAARKQASIVRSWVDSTDATRKAKIVHSVYDTAARNALQLEADGSNPLTKVLGSFSVPEVATSSNTTLDGSHFSIFEDTTGGNKTVTLPTAVGIAGRIYCIKNTGTGANTLTIATTSAQTIDGAAGASTSTPQACLIVQSDGANWQTLSSN